VLSETPTLFGHHRIALDALHDDPAYEKTRYIFNDHTPMEYAHPVWSKEVLTRLKADTSSYTVPKGGPPKARDEVDITRLLVGRVDGVFAVSQNHGRVMRAM